MIRAQRSTSSFESDGIGRLANRESDIVECTAGSGSSGRGIPEILSGRNRLRCHRRADVEESRESDRERAVGSHGPAHRVNGPRVVGLRHGALTLLHGAPTLRYGGCRAATQVVTHWGTVCTPLGDGV
jgi:hypothetical protein